MKILRILSILLFCTCLSFTTTADCLSPDGTYFLPACSGPESGVPGQDCCDDVNVPFDGGVSLLIAAGLGIGGMSIFKKKKKAE